MTTYAQPNYVLVGLITVLVVSLALYLSDTVRTKYARRGYSRIEKIALFHIVVVGEIAACGVLFHLQTLGLWVMSKYTIVEFPGLIVCIPVIVYVLMLSWGKRIKEIVEQ